MADQDRNTVVSPAMLAASVVRMCEHRGWSLHWTARGAYLHLESSELIEAIRGKHGDPLKEAADVLIVLMSITQSNDIHFDDVLSKASEIVQDLMTRARYVGEESNGKPLGARQ